LLLPETRVPLLFAELQPAHSSIKTSNRKLLQLQLPGSQALMQGLTGAMMNQAPQVRCNAQLGISWSLAVFLETSASTSGSCSLSVSGAMRNDVDQHTLQCTAT
jgi:hypothetical protein